MGTCSRKQTFAERLMEQYKPGEVFSVSDFRDYGVAKSTVRSNLSRLSRRGTILRLSEGYYARPRISRFTGRKLYPDSNSVARAVARKYGSSVMPSGAFLANKYQLSEQVPVQAEYLLNARSLQIEMGKTVIRFIQTSEDLSALADTIQGELMVALQYMQNLAKDTEKVRSCLSLALTTEGKSELNRWASSAPAWIKPLISELP